MSHGSVPGVVKQDDRGDTHEIADRRRTDAAPASVLDIISEDVFVAMLIQRLFREHRVAAVP
jgi:hypothetical protein